MSIVVGFHCSDGVVLASDTLYSGTMQNSYGDKLWVVHHANPVVVFGAAGTVGPITRARREIKRVIRTGMVVTEVLNAVDGVLKMVDQKFPSGTDQKHVQALIAVRDKKENALFQNIYGETSLSPVDGAHVCLGVDSLGNYFTALLYQNRMPMRWAKVVAAHLVRNCKRYASGYCGGETRLIEVPTTGDPILTTDSGSVEALESHFAPFEDAMRALLPGNDPNASDITLQHRFEELQKAINKVRGLAVSVINVEAGHVVLTGYAPTMSITEPILPPKPEKTEG
jgi:hypothetical protein